MVNRTLIANRPEDDSPLFFSCVLTGRGLNFRNGSSPLGEELANAELNHIVFLGNK